MWAWPQLVRIPRLIVEHDQTYTHDEMLELLQLAAAEFDGGLPQSLLTFWSSTKEGFIAAPMDENVPGGLGLNEGGDDESRQIVFLDADNFR